MLTNKDKRYLIESVLNEISGPAMMRLIKDFSRSLMQSHGRQYFDIAGTQLNKILKNREESKRLSMLLYQLKKKYPNVSVEGLKRIIRKHYSKRFPQYTQMLKDKSKAIFTDKPVDSEFLNLKRLRASLTPEQIKMMVFGNSRIPR